MKISDIRLYAAAVFAVAAGSFSVAADIPAGYYNSLSGKKEAELKTAVYERIHNFTINGSYDDVYYGHEPVVGYVCQSAFSQYTVQRLPRTRTFFP